MLWETLVSPQCELLHPKAWAPVPALPLTSCVTPYVGPVPSASSSQRANGAGNVAPASWGRLLGMNVPMNLAAALGLLNRVLLRRSVRSIRRVPGLVFTPTPRQGLLLPSLCFLGASADGQGRESLRLCQGLLVAAAGGGDGPA